MFLSRPRSRVRFTFVKYQALFVARIPVRWHKRSRIVMLAVRYGSGNSIVGMYRLTGSSHDIFFSSTNEATAATVNALVNDAASKIVFSSIVSGLLNSRT